MNREYVLWILSYSLLCFFPGARRKYDSCHPNGYQFNGRMCQTCQPLKFDNEVSCSSAVPHLTLCHAVSGGTVILPCAIKTSEKLNIFNYSIYWQINTSVVVHFFYNGKDLLKDQSRRYLNRTRLFLDQLERGNFSLMLSGVEPADEEVYTCILRNKGTKITHAVKLNVSSPDNQSIGRNVSPFGQTQDLPNCPGDAKALDILALCSHFLMVLVVWIL